MLEIGGYFELENFRGNMLHSEAVALNCGRNALAYLIEAREIKKICLPYFLCSSVKELCRKYNLEINYYSIDWNFIPQKMEFKDDEWIYLVNFYGQLSPKIINDIHKINTKLIVDNAQCYFEKPINGIDTIYTCRKFFGVSDGAFLYTDALLSRDLPRDESFQRVQYMLGRYERTASEFYSASAANNKLFADEPIKLMSLLTKNLLRAVDYDYARNTRTQNFAYLSKNLCEYNGLKVREIEGAFMYPLLISNAERVRKELQAEKIYIPVLWPNVLNETDRESVEWKMANNILPIPCDQRYGINEMKMIVNLICKKIQNNMHI